jgi:hypothetical protein
MGKALAIQTMDNAPDTMFFETATIVSDVMKIICVTQKVFFIPETIVFANDKIFMTMATIVSGSKTIFFISLTIVSNSKKIDSNTRTIVFDTKTIVNIDREIIGNIILPATVDFADCLCYVADYLRCIDDCLWDQEDLLQHQDNLQCNADDCLYRRDNILWNQDNLHGSGNNHLRVCDSYLHCGEDCRRNADDLRNCPANHLKENGRPHQQSQPFAKVDLPFLALNLKWIKKDVGIPACVISLYSVFPVPTKIISSACSAISWGPRSIFAIAYSPAGASFQFCPATGGR